MNDSHYHNSQGNKQKFKENSEDTQHKNVLRLPWFYSCLTPHRTLFNKPGYFSEKNNAALVTHIVKGLAKHRIREFYSPYDSQSLPSVPLTAENNNVNVTPKLCYNKSCSWKVKKKAESLVQETIKCLRLSKNWKKQSTYSWTWESLKDTGETRRSRHYWNHDICYWLARALFFRMIQFRPHWSVKDMTQK